MRFRSCSVVLAIMAAPASAQIGATRPATVIDTGRPPTLSSEAIAAVENARLRADVARLVAQVAKLQQQLDQLASRFDGHVHVVNGTVGNGFTSTIDGDKQFMRYVMPPDSNQDDLQLRTTGTPVQPH